MKYKVSEHHENEDEFDIKSFDVESSERRLVIRSILLFLFIAVSGCVAYSFKFGSGEMLNDLLSFLKIPLGIMIGYYFGRKK